MLFLGHAINGSAEIVLFCVHCQKHRISFRGSLFVVQRMRDEDYSPTAKKKDVKKYLKRKQARKREKIMQELYSLVTMTGSDPDQRYTWKAKS